MPSPSATTTATLGVFGARGAVGRELIGLLPRHGGITLAAAWSESLAGESVSSHVPGAPAELRFEAPDLAALEHSTLDVVALALPNGQAADAVQALQRSASTPKCIIDLSADHRFDDGWVYGLPETNRASLAGAERIANPGCYATAMGLALAPIRDDLAGVPHCFGVSGYSGAGSAPSDRNNVERLTGGVLPYASVGHIHEREVSHTLGIPIRFAPSVAPFERGIVMTTLFELQQPTDAAALAERYADHYSDEPLIRTIGDAIPRVQDSVGTPAAIIGGIQVDAANPTRGAVIGVIDNLRKGAATQALQNINLALGFPELEGLTP